MILNNKRKFLSFFLKEASFAKSSTTKVIDLVVSILTKKLGAEFFPYGGEHYSQHFKKSSGEGIGFLYFVGSGSPQKSVRFNFEDSKQGDSNSITSIDIWIDYKFNKPDFTVNIPSDVNIVETMDALEGIIEHPKVASVSISTKTDENNIEESYSPIDYKDILNEERQKVTPEVFMAHAKSLLKKEPPYTQDELVKVQNDGDMKIPLKVWNEFRVGATGVVKVPPVQATPQKPAVAVAEPAKAAALASSATPAQTNISVVKAESEKIVLTDTEKKAIDGMDVNQVFTDLEDITKLVLTGTIPSLIVAGQSGVGKSFVVMNAIKDSGLEDSDSKHDYIVIKGSITEASLYENLFYYRNSLLVFDDTDSVFKSETSGNMLKAALDSSGVRKISWSSKNTRNISGMTKSQVATYFELLDNEHYGLGGLPVSSEDDDDEDGGKNETAEKLKLPSSFEFKGRIIFITNLTKEDLTKKGMGPVISRSLFIDINLTPDQMFQRIKSNIDKISITDAEGNVHQVHSTAKKDTLDYMVREHKAGKLPQVSMRTFVNILKIRASGSKNWENMVKYVQL